MRPRRRDPIIPPASGKPETITGEFVDVPTAASLYFVSPPTIRRLLTLKKLTRYKFMGRTLVKLSELRGMVKS